VQPLGDSTPQVGVHSQPRSPRPRWDFAGFAKALALQKDPDMRPAGLNATLFLGLASLVACTTGDPNTNNDTRGITCAATFTVAGTFTASAARPADNLDGCWPIGMWTFTATMTDAGGCSPAPVPLGQYQMEGTLVQNPEDPTGPMLEAFDYVTDPNVRSRVGANEGGSGSCEGELDLYSADGKQVWLLKPETDTIDAMTTISGSGEYRTYTTDQYPY
jgi:hypothetical protein